MGSRQDRDPPLRGAGGHKNYCDLASKSPRGVCLFFHCWNSAGFGSTQSGQYEPFHRLQRHSATYSLPNCGVEEIWRQTSACDDSVSDDTVIFGPFVSFFFLTKIKRLRRIYWWSHFGSSIWRTQDSSNWNPRFCPDDVCCQRKKPGSSSPVLEQLSRYLSGCGRFSICYTWALPIPICLRCDQLVSCPAIHVKFLSEIQKIYENFTRTSGAFGRVNHPCVTLACVWWVIMIEIQVLYCRLAGKKLSWRRCIL